MFPEDVPAVHAFFKTNGTKNGDVLRAVWIAEDVGQAAAQETKIDEASVTGDKDNFAGSFSLSKPNKGWPVGEYRVEIYFGKELVKTANFEITAKTSEADDGDDADDDVHNDSGDDKD